jgi:hypothetical protein
MESGFGLGGQEGVFLCGSDDCSTLHRSVEDQYNKEQPRHLIH